MSQPPKTPSGRRDADSPRTRYQRAKEIFLASNDVPTTKRAAFVSTECSGDFELRAMVDQLLSNDEELDSDLDANVEGAGLPALIERPSIPEAIGRFQILRVLGRGGMGTVYLAEEHEPIRRRVAIKVIHVGLDSSEVLTRFEGERQALAMLDHPNIAKVLEAGKTDDGRPYLVLEYVDGEPITLYCDHHRLSIRDRVRLFEQVCRGVHHAGERGIVHRDIKPSNILVSEIDGEPHARIIDFGIAKATNLRLTEQTLYTELGRIVGTPQYMSPEQAALSSDELDTRSDVYSLGVVLYELVVGSLPLEWDSMEDLSFDEVRRRIREEDPVAPKSLWHRWNETKRQRRADVRATTIEDLPKEIDSGIRWIAVKALEKDPERRYSTAGALADDLRRYSQGEERPVAPPSTLYLLMRQVRRHRMFFLSALAVFTTMLIGLISTTWFAVESSNNEKIVKESRDELDQKLREILRFSDLRRISTYREKAKEIVPASSKRIPDLEAWLRDAQVLMGRLEEHEEALERLRVQIQKEGASALEDTEAQWQLETHERLVEELYRFNDANRYTGTISRVRRRLEFATTVKWNTIESPEASKAWREAIEAIRDETKSPMYAGFELEPQEGLLPLGPDPSSKLWEFAVVQTGQTPVRLVDDSLAITKESAIVLVLIPGGEFDMGARRPDENHPLGSPNVYEKAIRHERPIRRVRLDPYFISKFELTQSQWQRIQGENPAIRGPGSKFGDKIHTSLHPVEGVSWTMCHETLREVGLTIPTEAQWEFAARGGTTTPWSCGAEDTSLEGYANLADEFSQKNGGPPGFGYVDWDDGYTAHAPVGTYKPNPYGLYDVHGNVWEWCRESRVSYEVEPRKGDGFRLGTDDSAHMSRGGSFYDTEPFLRSTIRVPYGTDGQDATLGVRPARRIEKTEEP